MRLCASIQGAICHRVRKPDMHDVHTLGFVVISQLLTVCDDLFLNELFEG